MEVSTSTAAVAVLADGVVAGVFVGVALSVVPTLRVLGPTDYLRIHRLLGQGFHPAMPLIVAVGLVADTVLAVVDPGRRLAAGIAVLATVGVQVVSHFGNAPINRVVRAADVTALPSGWHDPRPLWRRFHYLRLALAFVAFALNVLVLVG